MMNQGVDAYSAATVDHYSVESRYIGAVQEQASSYPPAALGSETASWHLHGGDNTSLQNGNGLASGYQHDQQVQPIARNSQDGLNATLIDNTSALGTSSSQDHSYGSYTSTTDPYGYGSAEYANYYSGYQQQPGHPYTHQQTSHPYSQQQTNNSYSQPVGAYQNTGVAYQPLSSFENSGSYAGNTSYSTTYYNPGNYQTAGVYPSSGYSNQSTTWSDGNYANYASHHYPSYSSNTASAYNSGAINTTVNYQQHYKQWEDYYKQTEVSCAPGTEHLSVGTTSSQGSSVQSVGAGYPASNSRPPPSSASSWNASATSSSLVSVQPAPAANGSDDSYWSHWASSFQNQHATPTQPQLQISLDSKPSYNNFQEQNTASQGSNLQYAATHQVHQSSQPSMQSVPSLDTRRVGKLQIPTNPRIASNFAFGLSKVEKESSTAGTVAKPAYVSVSVPKADETVLSNDTADTVLKPNMFPKSLCGYVQRALARCNNDNTKLASCQAMLKEIITKATADGTLNTRDWDSEPLFPSSKTDTIEQSTDSSVSVSLFQNNKRSPSRRSKSRWEPLPEGKSVEKSVSAPNIVKYVGWDKKPISGNFEGKVEVPNFTLPEHRTQSKSSQRPVKRQRLAAGVNAVDNGDASSESDKEQSLTAYYSGALALANSPEEKKKRESRSKRFDKGHGHRSEINYYKPKAAGAGNLYTKRASALMLTKSFDDAGSRAVEDIDWDSLTVKGTCQEIEKRYLRLTSAPDPSTVRPEDVLERALHMVQNSERNYLYRCDQLKSIRQDLTVQHIRNRLTVKVYETHARLALQAGDLPEYNQCQSQLKTLYAEGIEGCHMEFAAYSLLCVILHSNNNRELLSSMSRLTEEAKNDETVKYALAVRAAVTSGNYVKFFKLYRTAPNLTTCLMDLCVDKMRYKAVNSMSRAYRPTVPVSYIALVLGFSNSSEEVDNISDGLEECVEWLKAHGACLITDPNGEVQFDAKASLSTLHVPEPEDAVAHGDANLAVNDFFARTSL